MGDLVWWINIHITSHQNMAYITLNMITFEVMYHHKFNMQWINNENCLKFIHSQVCTFYTRTLCVENVFNTRINVSMDEVQIHEWTNVTQILHLHINLCVKCVLNAWYQCVKHTNYKWMNFAWFPLLSCEMLSLWWWN
jgi:hypothetical protein